MDGIGRRGLVVTGGGFAVTGGGFLAAMGLTGLTLVSSSWLTLNVLAFLMNSGTLSSSFVPFTAGVSFIGLGFG
jgi:hypothetical protein